MDKDETQRRFTYDPPQPIRDEACTRLYAKARELAELITELTPVSRAQSVALTELETAVFWAQAAIARNES